MTLNTSKLVSELAASFRSEIASDLASCDKQLKLVGFLSTDNPASHSYAQYTASGCKDVGIDFDLREVRPDDLEELIQQANCDKKVDGILVYYPIFGTEKDDALKQVVDVTKDVEGLSDFWLNKLYSNDRFYDQQQSMKAILPCTPLAVLKVLEAVLEEKAPSGETTCFNNKTISIFNRSRVVGEPLAYMVSNDGARVLSFDINDVVLFEGGRKSPIDISREDALSQSDIVITGVPNKKFDLIRAEELRADAVCLNFAGIKNFKEEVKDKVEVFIPRIGTVTVAMCLRNSLRLFKRFHVD
jgi:methylenetetrahydrofolate dehydrogenase (NADP+)/methenyltetrahydrofolate cyclohydrolase